MLCTTHTIDDKLRTITMAREAGASSIPINILQPIKGTPLENIERISEEEVTRSVALMRFVAPKCTLHLAGGRSQLSKEAMMRILRGGMNGALVGDMLTTIGNKLDEDYDMFVETGYQI